MSLLLTPKGKVIDAYLTYVSENPDDLTPITPSVFIIQSIQSIETPDLEDISSNHLKRRWRYIQKTKESLRRRFRSEYLANLVQFGQRKQGKLKLGDIVLVGSDNSKRISWPIGKVIEIFTGKDNVARVAKLKLSTGSEVIRPFQIIYPLEISNLNTYNDFHKNLAYIPGNDIEPLEVDDDKKEIVEDDGNEPEQVVTRKEKEVFSRYGRLIKPLNVLNFENLHLYIWIYTKVGVPGT
ncbi:hypothetical protein NQ317_012366 [Molorchus minor]|uniref:DUF5641 domain-containing protein n=1 Tax=Molorchus minor TaxID=1323400 RepID=A0ABQ9JHC7_9CUCU|nr:hypothetical protein NQ317_012366 [Molorchus minor]